MMIGFKNTSEMREWLLNCPRFNTPKESWQAARARVKRPDWYRQATVSVVLNRLRVGVTMPVRHTRENCRRTDSLTGCIWPAEFPDQIRATGRHWEVLNHGGRFGFVTRLVVRGYPPEKSKPFIDLASIEFCIPYRAPRVFVDSGEPDAIEPEEITHESLEHPTLRQLYARPLTPGRLCSILSRNRRCCIETSGPTRVRGLFHRGRIHRVGCAFTELEEGGDRQADCVSAYNGHS